MCAMLAKRGRECIEGTSHYSACQPGARSQTSFIVHSKARLRMYRWWAFVQTVEGDVSFSPSASGNPTTRDQKKKAKKKTQEGDSNDQIISNGGTSEPGPSLSTNPKPSPATLQNKEAANIVKPNDFPQNSTPSVESQEVRPSIHACNSLVFGCGGTISTSTGSSSIRTLSPR